MPETAFTFTLLVDNNALEHLEKEHGFAAWIEAGDTRILFDTGQLGALQANADRLGIDLSTADFLVLSHGHYDHTGNLPHFLDLNSTARIIMAEQLQKERWSCKEGTEPRFIGMPDASKAALAAVSPERIMELKGPVYLMPGVGVTGPVPRLSPLEDTGGPFYLENSAERDDLIEDDQSMWFESPDGLVILLGCCHAGLVNTVDYIRQFSGMQKVRGIIGGMHLVNADDARLNFTFDTFKNWQPEFLVPCHCTGEEQTVCMVQSLGEQLVKPGHAGMVIKT